MSRVAHILPYATDQLNRQVTDLRPYIPGSALKARLSCLWVFDMIKQIVNFDRLLEA